MQEILRKWSDVDTQRGIGLLWLSILSKVDFFEIRRPSHLNCSFLFARQGQKVMYKKDVLKWTRYSCKRFLEIILQFFQFSKKVHLARWVYSYNCSTLEMRLCRAPSCCRPLGTCWCPLPSRFHCYRCHPHSLELEETSGNQSEDWKHEPWHTLDRPFYVARTI